MLILTSLFSGIGILGMYFLQKYGSGPQDYDGLFMKKNILFMIIGILLGMTLYFIDYQRLHPYSKYVYGFTILILLYVLTLGRSVNGQVLYINILGRSINVIQIGVYSLIVSLAGIFTGWNWDQPKSILSGIGLVLLPFLLIAAAPSVVLAAIFLVAALGIMGFSGMRLSHLTSFFIIISTILLFAIGGQSYRLDRLLIFLNPYKDPYGAGYASIQSKEAIFSAGIFGKGLGSDILIGELHTNFMFAYLVHTFGWIMGFTIITLVIFFILRLIRLSSLIKNSYGKLLLVGFSITFSIQFIYNILMTLGLAPMVGISLPFISYGGLSMVINFIVIGMICSVYKRRILQRNI